MDGDLRQTITALEEENARLKTELKKQARNLMLAESSITKYKAGVVAHENLTQYLQAERVRQDKYMTLLLENCPDMIILLDPEGRFVFCTDAYLRNTGIKSFGEIKGKQAKTLFPKDYNNVRYYNGRDMFVEALKTHGTQEIDIALDFGNGHRDYKVVLTPIFDDTDSYEYMLVIFHDVTELMHEKERADYANRAKSDFLVTISHEIRTPMNAVIGMSNMLKKTELSEKQLKYTQNILESSALLLNLINDLLDFSKIEAGKLDILPEDFDLFAMLSKLNVMFTFMAEQKGLKLNCKIDGALPQDIFADEKRYTQILNNLLNNAVKYTKEGSVTFSVRAENGRLRCDVIDTGIGIRAEEIPKLFTAFEQLDKVKNKNVVGTGMGLAITRRLCDMPGGAVEVSSEYGKGSRFTVFLPLTPASKAPAAAVTAAAEAFTAEAAAVLLVDDIELNLVVAEAILSDLKITPDSALSGAAALEMCAKKPYDLIFMDHMMPEMDGLETVKRLRAGGINAQTPIVALTANAIVGSREFFIANGFNDFLSKPIDPDLLSACVKKWLPEELVKKVNS